MPERAARAKLVIADDHAMVVEGLRRSLEPRYRIVAIAHSGKELLAILPEVEADCLLLDMGMPERNGLDLMPDIRALRPDLKVLIVTMYLDRVLADTVLHAGANGFVPKDSGVEELEVAIRTVLRGEQYLSPRVPPVSNRVALGAANPGLALLTPRQHEIIRLIGRGKTSAEIARALSLTDRSVQFHRANIRKALGLSSEFDLTRYAILFLAEGEGGAE
jgi:DNA-binding NarL/FixJ family response regulator